MSRIENHQFDPRAYLAQAASRGGESALNLSYQAPYTPNSTIEDLVNGSLSHRGPHNEASTEQKALDGVATVVLRELSNRTKEINRLRAVEAELNSLVEREQGDRAKDRETHKYEVGKWRDLHEAASRRAEMHEKIINEAIKVLGVECDLDGLPGKLADVLPPLMSENAVSFIAANGVSPVVSGDTNGGPGCHYVLEDGREFDLSVRECRAIGEIHWAAGNARWQTATATNTDMGGFGTGTATGEVMLTNIGTVSVKGGDDA